MATFDKEVDHYEVIVQNSDGAIYAIKEFSPIWKLQSTQKWPMKQDLL